MSKDNLNEENEVCNRASYHRNYYAENKERILAQRRKRYKNDDDYRQASLAKRRRERHLLQKEVYTSLEIKPEVEVKHDCIMKVLSADQTKSAIVKMYTPKGVAMKIGIEKSKFVHWVYLGKLPNANYRNERNWRLYTEYEVQILVRAFNKFKKKARLNNYRFRLSKEMTEYIQTKFTELVGGVPAEEFKNND